MHTKISRHAAPALLTLALVGIGLTAGTAGTANALTDPVAGTCSGSLSLPVPVVRLITTAEMPTHPTLFDRSERVGLQPTIAAGSYTANGGSRDLLHPQLPDQQHEQWYAVFTDTAGNEVGRTTATPDLINAQTFQAWNLGTLVLTRDATAVQYVHADVTYGPGEASLPESVEPACLALTPVPVITTTTMAPTTTMAAITTTTLGAVTPPAYPYNPTTTTVVTVIKPAEAPLVVTPTPTTAAPVPTTVPSVVVVPQTPTPTAEVLGTVVTRPLALTGSDPIPALALGLTFLAGGSALMLSSSRRRHLFRRNR